MMAVRPPYQASGFIIFARQRAFEFEENEMKKLLLVVLSLLLASALAAATQNKNTNKNTSGSTNSNKTTNTNRKPIFRATADQIKQAQAILKQRSFYSGEQTGKLDDGTREGLKKYQLAETLKVTGTLNKVTLEKMGVPLTDKQKTM
jgi:peptidoglycan hydrolase-like protein with peptidoglycan-binding domain